MKPWMLIMTLFIGCVKAHGPVVYVREPEALIAYARTRPIPKALQARLSVHIDSPNVKGTAPASLILEQPNHLRIELYTPIGTPLMYVSSNGESLHVWSQRDRTFYRGDHATEVLQRITGGVVGIDDLLAFLMGSLPLADSEILHIGRTVFEEDGVVLTLLGPDDLRIRTVVDPSSGMVRRLRVDRPGTPLDVEEPNRPPVVEVHYIGDIRLGRTRLPEQVEIRLPELGWTITMNFRSWKELTVAPEVFELKPPPRARVTDLEQVLESLSKRARPLQ